MAADVGSMFRYRTRFDVRRLQMLNVTIIRELSARFLEEEGSQQQDERSLLIGTRHPTLQQNFQRAPVYIYYYRGARNWTMKMELIA
ncbi:homeobox protein cut-like 2 [Falco naumanni]|uniref:homeobox protein cut-like 2 n=1 Tax=Falco naumanni TaxID=148594 RepID=UPI001ADE2B6F|nr:homeobox protein cut-like 2 [Falco naumanni]